MKLNLVVAVRATALAAAVAMLTTAALCEKANAIEWSATGMTGKQRRDYIVWYLTENHYTCPLPRDSKTKKLLTVAQQEDEVNYQLLPWAFVYGYILKYCTQLTPVQIAAKKAPHTHVVAKQPEAKPVATPTPQAEKPQVAQAAAVPKLSKHAQKRQEMLKSPAALPVDTPADFKGRWLGACPLKWEYCKGSS